MAKPLLPDGLWVRIEPLLPVREPQVTGRPRVPDRAALTGIIFVLKTGIPWEDLPQEMGCGSGMTCWRRLHEWNEAGVWSRLHQVLLDELHDVDQLDWSRAVVDSSHVRAKGGGEQTGPSPVDRARLGSKHHLIVDGNGTPLAFTLTGGHRHDITQLTELVDRVPPTGRHGKFRPRRLYADRAYDSKHHRRELRERGITPKIAKRNSQHGSGLGRDRWVVERTISWLHAHRYLARRHARRADIHEAMLTLACARICLKQLQHFC
ncbi:MAG TPA: IS5 family transposase [Solirubrobacteraceae bacterium]|nr:IS5 family transposase [Solirubrobacteraceae bacterium]